MDGISAPLRALLAMAAAIAVLFAAVPGASAQLYRDPQDVIILLDTSASMAGQGSDPKAQNIWPQVTRTVADLVQTFPASTRVLVMPFDRGVDPSRERTFDTRPSPQELNSYLAGLKPTGQETWIYEAVDTALGQLETWAKDHQERPQALFLYTDGLDNGPHADTWLSDLGNRIKLHRGDYPYLYVHYQDLQSQLTPVQSAQLQRVGVDYGKGIAVIKSQVLDFGALAPGQKQAAADLAFTFANAMAPAKVTFQLAAGGLPIHVQPADAMVGTSAPTVKLTLFVDGPIAAGEHTEAHLSVDPAAGLPLQGSRDVPIHFAVTASATATATAVPPSPTALPATSTAVPPTATSIPATATPAPPPLPPAPPDMQVTVDPSGPELPLDALGFRIGWPTQVTQPANVRLTVTVYHADDARKQAESFAEAFAPDGQPVFHLYAIPAKANAAVCAATHLCSGVAFQPAGGAQAATEMFQPAALVKNGDQLQLRVVGDGTLKDGKSWHAEQTIGPLQAHRPGWAALWNGLGIGYWGWAAVLALVLLGISAVDTRTNPPFQAAGKPIYYHQVGVKEAGDDRAREISALGGAWVGRFWRLDGRRGFHIATKRALVTGPLTVRTFGLPAGKKGPPSAAPRRPGAGPDNGKFASEVVLRDLNRPAPQAGTTFTANKL